MEDRDVATHFARKLAATKSWKRKNSPLASLEGVWLGKRIQMVSIVCLFNLPVWCLQKSDESWRINVDYHKLNQGATLIWLSWTLCHYWIRFIRPRVHGICHWFARSILFHSNQKIESEIVHVHEQEYSFTDCHRALWTLWPSVIIYSNTLEVLACILQRVEDKLYKDSRICQFSKALASTACLMVSCPSQSKGQIAASWISHHKEGSPMLGWPLRVLDITHSTPENTAQAH